MTVLPRILPNWALTLPDILLAFPHAAPSKLLASAGDRRKIVAHLAFSNDLTLAETSELLALALARSYKRQHSVTQSKAA